jgi:hypothetical protein
VLSVLLSCAFTSLSLGGLVVVSTHIIDQTRAQIAADAAALGAVYGGETVAQHIALRNGAQYATAHARDSWAQQLPTMSP